MSYGHPKLMARRHVLGAGVAGAALLVIPEGCASSGSAPDASADVKRMMDAACPAADYVKRLNIADAGIAKQGTSYEFTDSCYSDPVCFQNRIIVIHPVTKDVYVALSGSCTHECCDNVDGEGGPKYYKTFTVDDDGGAPEAGPDEGGTSEAGDAGTHDAAIHEASTTEASALDASTHDATIPDTGAPDASTTDAETEGGISMTYTDVLYCDCHGSIFSALDGTVLRLPAPQPLQLLTVSESDGSLVITIPKS
jgi:hypothetical protein